MDGVIQPCRVKRNADGDQGIHLVVLLRDRVVLSILLEVLRSRHVNKNVAKHADGVCISAHHHVRKSDIVVRCEMCCHDTGEHGFFVELNVVQGLESKTKVAQKTVHPQKADDGEVSQHFVQGPVTVFSSILALVLASLHRRELFADL